MLGEIPPCGEFPEEVINATTSLEDLWAPSKWAQFAVKGVVGRPTERRDAPLKSCLEEVVAGGGVQGPFFFRVGVSRKGWAQTLGYRAPGSVYRRGEEEKAHGRWILCPPELGGGPLFPS